MPEESRRAGLYAWGNVLPSCNRAAGQVGEVVMGSADPTGNGRAIEAYIADFGCNWRFATDVASAPRVTQRKRLVVSSARIEAEGAQGGRRRRCKCLGHLVPEVKERAARPPRVHRVFFSWDRSSPATV